MKAAAAGSAVKIILIIFAILLAARNFRRGRGRIHGVAGGAFHSL